jgi:hypothetical protein
MGFHLESRGNFRKTEAWLQRLQKIKFDAILRECGQQGVEALRAATPVETGLASQSWDYKVSSSSTGATIDWRNFDIENGFNVVISLQFGYSTGTGGYVPGRDFINPAMRPVFDSFIERIRAEVSK